MKVNATGGRATFNAPPNLGTFVLRAIAVSPSLEFGTSETEIIVRRSLSVTAAIPRFARVSDSFSAGVIVTQQGSCGQPANCPDVTVTVSINGTAVELAPEAVAEQNIPLGSGQT